MIKTFPVIAKYVRHAENTLFDAAKQNNECSFRALYASKKYFYLWQGSINESIAGQGSPSRVRSVIAALSASDFKQ